MKKFLVILIILLFPLFSYGNSDLYVPQTITCQSFIINDEPVIKCNQPAGWNFTAEPGVGTYTFLAASARVEGGNISAQYQKTDSAFSIISPSASYKADTEKGKWYAHGEANICGNLGGVINMDCPYYLY